MRFHYAQPDEMGYYAEPPEMYGWGEPEMYGQYEPMGYYAEDPYLAEDPYGEVDPYGNYAESPEMYGYGEPDMYGQAPEMLSYAQYEPQVAGYVRDVPPAFNAGCPLPTNVAGFGEAQPLEGYTRPTEVSPTVRDFTPQPGPTPSVPETFRPLW